MTPNEWNESRKPHELLRALGPRLAGRKFQLFLCAAGRRLLDEAPDEYLELAIANSERFMDGEIDPKTFRDEENRILKIIADSRHEQIRYGSSELILRAISAVLASDMRNSLRSLLEYGRLIVAGDASAASRVRSREAFDVSLCRIIREIFPYPGHDYVFRPSFAGGGLHLPNGEYFHIPETARAIALGIQSEQAYDRLPILADALEDADCPDRDWLDHLRYGTDHVRGCWALDLAMGVS